MNRSRVFAAAALVAACLPSMAFGQPAAGRGGRGGPAVVSPEVSADGHVTFRLLAPDAAAVTFLDDDFAPMLSAGGPGPLAGSTTPAVPAGTKVPAGGLVFTKGPNGIWETSFGPLPPGAYRYAFQVDGARVIDPANTHTSESNTLVWSLFSVPGSPLMDTRDVPHGAVASVFYYSAVLKTTRRMHIYTPPGYEAGNQKYPVFYLLHGAMDTDDAWTSVGRAGFILDNLLADKKIKPMIVVMPAGHQPGQTGMPAAAPASGAGGAPAVNPFTSEFMTDMLPYVEKHYRVIPDRQHRAIAGLSMGGSQTLDIAFRHLDMFAYIGVFSSGASLGGGRRGPAAGAAPAAATAAPAPAAPPQNDWETQHLANLDNAALKKGLKLIWLSTGVDDGLITNTRSTVEMLKKHGFQPVFQESAGAHSWFNWRNYLIEFTPRLF
ncbi:MAG TPA: alpha/beta hydrolase-fold protein [Bryobacteraceae bacterium]|nr:alpha/beta hydrolase-fold protein [Bryobacteraceae bacterium]